MVAKTNFSSVDEYISAQPEALRVALKRVRGAIRKALPRAEEVVSYNMPTYKVRDRRVLYFAGWKQHYALYAATDSVVAAFKDELVRYEVEKGTIRFPLSEPVPVKLIERIAKFRAQEAAEREKATRRSRRSNSERVKSVRSRGK